MKNLLFILIPLLTFSSCKKENKYSVVYTITEVSANTPTYTITYTLSNGTTQSVGNITNNSWTSGTLTDYKSREILKLTLEGSGGGIYEMKISSTGGPTASRVADDNNGVQILETQLPH